VNENISLKNILLDNKIQGLSIDELALKYNESPSNIKVILHRTLQKLKESKANYEKSD
jgi:DNA-directed RNA polymerase specialized sigma24 family protein